MIPVIPEDQDWTFETKRLLLTPIRSDDAPELFELLKEPSLYEFTGGNPPLSVSALANRFRLWESRRSPADDELWLNWTVRLKSGAAAGYIQATVQPPRALLAWVIGLPFQGNGYATEASRCAAEWLKIRFIISELRANIHPAHSASQKVAEHLGLRPSVEVTNEGEEVWTSASLASP